MFNFVYNGVDFAHKIDHAYNPQENHESHIHPFTEIFYLVKGNVIYTVDTESRKLSPGDLVVIAPGKHHFASVTPDEPYERYVLKFPDETMPPFLPQKIKYHKYSPFFVSSKKFSTVFSLMDTFYENYNNDKDGLYALLISETVKLLVFLSREPTVAPDVTNTTVSQFIKYINENITKNITIETLSSEFHFSKSYVSNEFKKQMQTPIIQYIREKKILAAHERILSGEKKSTVAQMFGFENYSTFYRQYTKLINTKKINHSPTKVDPNE